MPGSPKRTTAKMTPAKMPKKSTAERIGAAAVGESEERPELIAELQIRNGIATETRALMM